MSNFDDKDIINKQSDGETVHRSRIKKKEEEKAKKRKRSQISQERAAKRNTSPKGSATDTATTGGTEGKKSKKRKYKMNWKQFIKFAICVCILIGFAGVVYVGTIIAKTPDIDTSNIYSMLSQSSVLYDDKGQVIDNVVGADGEDRTIVELKDIPVNLQNAFIALEDKTFKTHHGFNVKRIFGAIKDAVFSGGGVRGTSTITQQLARNLYLEDKKDVRSLTRKIQEAYYSVIMEKRLNKDQILEAYLNTVYFGDGYGVQAASQAYFSKDVEELTLPESAALAAMPQLPSAYALVKQVSANDINDETENLILKSGDVAYVWNDTAAPRIKTCLGLMLEQGLITQAEYDEAIEIEIKDIVNPNLDALNSVSNYFSDYVITTVINDLQEELGYTYEQAHEKVYSGGLKIHTTMDSTIQQIIEKEFKNDANFPTLIVSRKDGDENILDEFGRILLYKYSNYIDSNGYFKLKSGEFDWNNNGSLTVYAGKRLHLYDTTVQGQSDVSVELKNMYVVDEGTFYTVAGGYLNIPQQYKSKDKDGNLVISAEFFTDYPDYFEKDGNKLATKGYTLQQRVIQPQSAMTIIDNETGYVKAMVGGRKVNGRMMLNRAVSPRQSGSSIKPLSVYSAALQRSFELEAEGKEFPLVDSDFGFQGDDLWGRYLTAGSIIDDEPTTVNGKKWPTNSGNTLDGLITMRRALQKSLNICAVKITQQVGTDFSFDLLEKYGLTTLVREGEVNDNNLAALALGGQSKGVTTLEMASAYNTFVNDGKHKSYNVYSEVTTRNGDVLLEAETTETEVLDKGVAWITRDMLQSVVTNGLGAPAAVSGAKAGGKTGTTSDQFDIWYDGFTAKYSAALWIGSDINIKLSSMSGTAARLWGKIMNQIPDVASGTYSKKPDNVISVSIDTKSGMLATEASGNDVTTEYFTKGTQPTEPDTLHQVAEVCAQSGYLATPSCHDVKVKIGIKRPYAPNKRVPDYKNEVPHFYCNLHNPDPKVYPVKKGEEVTIVPPIDFEDPDVSTEPTDPTDPDNPQDPILPPEDFDNPSGNPDDYDDPEHEPAA